LLALLSTSLTRVASLWTKRAKQIDALALNTAGMYGELEALMGTALPAIETLQLPPPVPLRSAS
jgi:hypothetical protein